MKNKTKLALAAAGLSCTVLAALGGSSYAWFVTQNSVGVNHSNLTVQTDSGNLKAWVKYLNPASDDVTEYSNVSEASTNFTLSDLSSKFGDTFYKKTNGKGDGYVLATAQQLAGAVLQFGIKVQNLPTSDAKTLRLNASIQHDGNAASIAALTWVRTAVYACSDDNYNSPLANGIAVAFMKDKTATGANKYVNGLTEQDVMTYADGELYSYGNRVDIRNDVQAQSNFYFKVSIWMEGTVVANQNDGRGANFSITTSFSLA